MGNDEEMQIFVCATKEDGALARELCTVLQGRGFRIQLDLVTQSEALGWEEIRYLETSDWCIVILSENGENSGHIQRIVNYSNSKYVPLSLVVAHNEVVFARRTGTVSIGYWKIDHDSKSLTVFNELAETIQILSKQRVRAGGKTVVTARLNLGLSQADLAASINVPSEDMVAKLERAELFPKPYIIAKLADRLGLDWEELTVAFAKDEINKDQLWMPSYWP